MRPENYSYLCSPKSKGALAERLGTGLQNLLQQFDSARHLKKRLWDYLRGVCYVNLTLGWYWNHFWQLYHISFCNCRQWKSRVADIIVSENTLEFTEYLSIIVHDKELQERFIENCRIMIRIDKATWDSQTSRIRNASAGGRIVSQKALQLRGELYERLGIPSEFRLWG